MSADDLYGPCLPAGGQGIETLELRYRPRTLQLLNRASARDLQLYLQSAAGLILQQVVHEHTTLLWVMDESCDIYFAQEEMILADSGDYLMPFLRSNKIYTLFQSNNHGRLGHPALVMNTDRAARIGGEIQFTPEESTMWTLNRSSGRYGRRPHQTLAHLVAAHQIFTEFGLQIACDEK